MSDERFVVDGYERLTSTSEYRAEREKIIAEVEARYAEPLAGAGVLRRIALLLQRRREIARKLAESAPPDALYFRRT
jgi:hypothetical protein